MKDWQNTDEILLCAHYYFLPSIGMEISLLKIKIYFHKLQKNKIKIKITTFNWRAWIENKQTNKQKQTAAQKKKKKKLMPSARIVPQF